MGTKSPKLYIYIYIYIERERERENHTGTDAEGLDIVCSKVLESHLMENSDAISCINWIFFSLVGGFEVKFSANYY